MYRRLFLVTPTLLLGNLPVAAQERPALLLANVYTPGVRLADYWVSEKFDGVRGYWTGQQLLTRGGEVIHAPVGVGVVVGVVAGHGVQHLRGVLGGGGAVQISLAFAGERE